MRAQKRHVESVYDLRERVETLPASRAVRDRRNDADEDHVSDVPMKAPPNVIGAPVVF